MRLAWLLLLAASCPALAAPARAQVPAPAGESHEARVARRVLDPRHRVGRSNTDLVRELVGLGPRAAPVLVGLLTGVLPGTDWEESGLTLEESRAAQGDEEALLKEALRGLPGPAVAQALCEACGGTAPLDRRLVGLHLLAEVGTGARAVDCWRVLGSGIEEIHLRRAYVRAQLESALARCLERSAAGFDPLRRELREWEPRLLPAVVRACAAANRRPGVEVLSRLRGLDRELDLELLRKLPVLAAATAGSLGEPELAWLRGFLQDEDPEVRSEALLGLGRVCDPGSVQALLDGLDDADERVAQAALWSLKHASRLSLPGGSAAWESWLAAESDWYEGPRSRCLRALESQDPARVVEALHELTLHPLFRHEHALAIADLLGREETVVPLAACAGLRQLGSMAAAAELAALLSRPEAELRAAAHAALLALTGRQLPQETEAWQQALGN